MLRRVDNDSVSALRLGRYLEEKAPLAPTDSARRVRTFAMPSVVFSTVVGAAVAFGVLPAEPRAAVPEPAETISSATDAIHESLAFGSRSSAAVDISIRTTDTSRAATRAPVAKVDVAKLSKAEPTKAAGVRWATSSLRLRTQPNTNGEVVATVDQGAKLTTTGVVSSGWRQLVYNGKTAWAKDEYLASKAPVKNPGNDGATGSSPAETGASCPQTLPGITARARIMYNAMCSRFPQIKSYGGVRPDRYPAHPEGRAIDAMTKDRATGQALANWLRANAAKYGIEEIIYYQRIWTPQRASEGWRAMSDRGSPTANHMDHVHVAVY